ncbi:PRC-barrel domain-containing protein [Streptomyces boninensis]|uniref:PRC-barrel domain-containing protein n=1 Tax=Streptomyces boninensis TaxID=2039455 RepID=UPI003B2196F6
MMFFSTTTGRPVISSSDAAALGSVDGFDVNATTGCVARLTVKLTGGSEGSVNWADIEALGADAVILPAQTVIHGPAEIPDHDVLSKKILSEHGRELGTVKDVGFDPDSGAIQTVVTSAGEMDGSRILGLGSYALVVRVPEFAGARRQG